MNLSREINVLKEPTSDRSSKLNALDKVSKHLKKLEPESLNLELESWIGVLSKCIKDPIERVRENSVNLLSFVAKSASRPELLMPVLIPVLVQQLGQPKIVEVSEEIRLAMVKDLVKVLVERSNQMIGPFVDEIFVILQRTCLDSYQEVRKESFQIVCLLCELAPKQVYLKGGSTTKLLLPSLGHRHSSVRVFCLQALTKAVLNEASAIDDTIEILRQLTMDKAHIVRENVYILAREWMCNLIDRHVYGYKILPLLYAGLSDEMKRLQDLSRQFLEDAGKLYEQDNKDRIKDELDYSDGLERESYTVLTLDRPRPGSRHVARDNTQRIVNRQIELLVDWNVENRYKAALVLTSFIDYSESHITGYIGIIFPAVYKVLAGDELHIMNQVNIFISKLAQFVNPDITINQIIPALGNGAGGLSSFRLGCLRTFESILDGTPKEKLQKHTQLILNNLSEKELLQNENIEVMIQICKCMEKLANKIQVENDLMVQYFYILIQIYSIPGDEKVLGWSNLRQNVRECFEKHSKYLNFTVHELFEEHLLKVLENYQLNYKEWNQYSIEPRIIENMCIECGDKVFTYFDKLIPILVENVGLEKDFEVRQRFIQILLKLFKSFQVEKSDLNVQFSVLLKDIILKCCIWRPGKKAVALRMLATELLFCILRKYEPLEILDYLKPLMTDHIIPVLISNLDDDEEKTRINCLFILDYLAKVPCWEGEMYKKTYVELLKRMDDAKDSVRIICGNIWGTFLYSIATWQDRMKSVLDKVSEEERGNSVIVIDNQVLEVKLDNTHFETMIDGLLIHLDDTNNQVQESVYTALRSGKTSNLFPEDLFLDKIQQAKSKHRDVFYLDKLLN